MVKAVPNSVPFFEDQGGLLLETHASHASHASHHSTTALTVGTNENPIRAVMVMAGVRVGWVGGCGEAKPWLCWSDKWGRPCGAAFILWTLPPPIWTLLLPQARAGRRAGRAGRAGGQAGGKGGV